MQTDHHRHRLRRPVPPSWAETTARVGLGSVRHLSPSLQVDLLGCVRRSRLDTRGPGGWQCGRVEVISLGSTIAVDEAMSEAGALTFAAALAGPVGIARRLPVNG